MDKIKKIENVFCGVKKVFSYNEEKRNINVKHFFYNSKMPVKEYNLNFNIFLNEFIKILFDRILKLERQNKYLNNSLKYFETLSKTHFSKKPTINYFKELCNELLEEDKKIKNKELLKILKTIEPIGLQYKFKIKRNFFTKDINDVFLRDSNYNNWIKIYQLEKQDEK